MFVRMIPSEPQNVLFPNLVWWCSIMSRSIMQKKNCLLYSLSKSQRGPKWSKYDSFCYIFWTADSFATYLNWMVQHHKPECLVKEKRTTACKVKVTAKAQNVRECLSRWYLLNCQTFCRQTRYCDSSSSAGVPCKKIGLLFSRSRSQQGLIWLIYMTVSTISYESLILLLLTWFESTLL